MLFFKKFRNFIKILISKIVKKKSWLCIFNIFKLSVYNEMFNLNYLSLPRNEVYQKGQK